MKPFIALIFFWTVPAASALQLPAPNIAALVAQDALQKDLMPFRFAAPMSVKITPATHGAWSTLADGRLLWALAISSPGATSLNFAFTRYGLPAGAQLKISGGPDVRGPYTDRENALGQLWTPVVRSSSALLELTLPAAAKNQVALELTQVNYGFRGFGAKDVVNGKSGDCNVDVACPAGDEWRNEIRSVARISIGGALLCTGTLINNTAQDFTPYFLTAAHCASALLAPTTVFYWNYATSPCGGTPNGKLDQTQSGATFVASSLPVGESTALNPGSDFTLLKLSGKPDPAFKVFYAGWDNRDLAPKGVTVIHHPSGNEKRISFDFDQTLITAYGLTPADAQSQIFPTHLQVLDYDVGTTEGGSSGSGLWNSEHHLVGTLSGGGAACGNDLPDWYGRLNQHWFAAPTPATSVASSLDPSASGVTTLDGADPNRSKVAPPPPVPAASSTPSGGGAMPMLALSLLLLAALRRKAP